MPAVALGVGISAARAADPVAGKVVGVHGGDTITVLAGEKTQIKVRLHGIDAPESGQAFGRKSKQGISGLVFGKAVQLDIVDRDRHGRSVANIHADGIWVNERMVSTGMAWHYKAYSEYPGLAKAGVAAREKRLGLWHDADPVPPWVSSSADRCDIEVNGYMFHPPQKEGIVYTGKSSGSAAALTRNTLSANASRAWHVRSGERNRRG